MQANHQGLSIPNGYDLVKNCVKPFLAYDEEFPVHHWPPYDALACLALAQHFGAPTRLLDWSFDPYVAAYFAAEDAILRPSDDPFLAVWVYHRSTPELILGNLSSDFVTGLEVYKPPYYGNVNARSQRGQFTYVRSKQASVPESIEWYETRRRKELNISGDEPFLKMKLPVAESRRLLRLLSSLDISATTLFPGYNGAIKAAQLNKFALVDYAEQDQVLAEWNSAVQEQAETEFRMQEEGYFVVESDDSEG